MSDPETLKYLKEIKLDYPLFSNNECPVIVKREDTNDLVKTINSEIGRKIDVVYLGNGSVLNNVNPMLIRSADQNPVCHS